ncbi:dihydrolipoamide dehydrogenase [Stella humosa]|uniref:Dihydrolipoyl dehydrogenase n=1 Tax=Stella humosa TaxID=94 RepID=A0A3N1M7D4_9PROT|nr:dihydrolipoamide dehydrogenase [Stella humosa]BBK31185.1 dihydrolipoyl dehydrogenase [Stella humosa]
MLVVGAGPGGYVAAIRAGQLGLDTVIVEAGRPGGTCLNIGCIPSKALIHAAGEFHHVARMARGQRTPGISVAAPSFDLGPCQEWKGGIVNRLTNGVAELLKRARVKTVEGTARFRDGKTVEVATATGTQVIRAANVVIATGSVPVELSFLPFGGRVISSTEALALTELPRRLVVVGAGYIGLELGMAFAKLGSEVAIVEAADRILPQYDAELTRPVAERLRELGVTPYLGAKAQGMAGEGALLIETADGTAARLPADAVLVTVGRRPRTEGWGREELALAMNGPFVAIDEQCRTAMRGVYAVGDVTGEPMLAHRAMAQGEMVAEIIAGQRRAWDKVAIPAICFTDPEIVTVGLSPDGARAAGIETRVGRYPLSANGRAMTMEAESGFVRIVARADNHLVLGMQAVGAGVGELSATFGLALEMGARLEDVAGTIHAHPTLGECVQEAAMRALGHAIHI